MDIRRQDFRLALSEYCGISPAGVRGFSEVISAADENVVRSLVMSGEADCAVLGYCSGHEQAADIAAELAVQTSAAVLLLFFGDAPSAVIRQCAEAGVLVGHVNALNLMLSALRALCTRLHRLENTSDTLRQRLNDAGLVNRAKLLLMSHLNMSESQAHRYIEKTAMDSSRSRREIAENIIKLYED